MDLSFLVVAATLYFLATGGFVVHLLFSSDRLHRGGSFLLASGFTVHTLALLVRAFEAGYLPVTSFHEGLSLVGWLVVGAQLLLERRSGLGVLGAFVAPLAFLFTFSSYVFYSGVEELPESLKNAWLPVHIAPAFLGYAILGVAFCLSLAYLLQENQLKAKRRSGLFRRLPSLERLDELNHRFVTWGFALFTLAIVTGAVLAKTAWGAFWSWEPVEVWSAVTWLLYAVLLQMRSAGWRGRRAATLTIVGFAVLVVSFFGMNLVFPGRHGGRFGS
ncbi:MAG: c-type cytochrome biogenesis protein CcsB [Candidatus Binatia bacterium]|nr:MAG: c-type cytochrome biogenesis protein CcsB [Candidatus Binatia bacterium]